MNRRAWTVISLGLAVAFGLSFLPSGLTSSRAKEVKTDSATVTFNKDVAPILFANCAECHRPGESAPMSLLSYQEARPWARSIKEKVAARFMPPWHADPHVGTWSNDRRLTQTEIETIVAWVDGCDKEGYAKDGTAIT